MENPGVKNGVIAGLIIVVVSLLTYFFDAKTYLSPSTQWGLMVIYLFSMWRAGTEARAENGGFISFREIIKPIFLSAVIASLMVIVFQYVLYNFIDPTLLQIQGEMAIETIESMEGLIGEEAVEQAIEEMERVGFHFSIGSAISGWLVSLIMLFIPSAIIGLILRRKNPQETSF